LVAIVVPAVLVGVVRLVGPLQLMGDERSALN